MNPRSEFLEEISKLAPADPQSASRTAIADRGGIAICGDHVELHLSSQARTSASFGVYCQVGVAAGIFVVLVMAWLLGVPFQGMPFYITVWVGFLTGLATGIAVWRKDRGSDA